MSKSSEPSVSLKPGEKIVQEPVPVVDGNWNVNTMYSYLSDYDQYGISSYQYYVRAPIRQLIAGLDTELDSFRLYLDEKLHAEMLGRNFVKAFPLLSVEGPSGVGKSTALFGKFSLLECPKVWITSHLGVGTEKAVFGVRFNIDGTENVASAVSFHELRDIIIDLPDSSPDIVSVVVFDGVFEGKDPLSVFLGLLIQKSLFAIRCASGESSAMEKNLISCDIRPLRVPSFTLREYVNAKEAGHPKLASRPLNTFTQWFYIVGGNARVVFQRDTLTGATGVMNYYMSKIDRANRDDIIAGTATSASRSIVNNLLGMIPTNPYIPNSPLKSVCVSQYVMTTFLEGKGLKSIEIARNLIPHNPSYLDWIFEEEMLVRAKLAIRASEKFTLYDRSGTPVVRARLTEIRRFTDLRELAVYGTSGDAVVWVLFKPNNHCNPGYDGMLVRFHGKESIVYILQCTVAPTHSCDLKYASGFLDQIFNAASGSDDATAIWSGAQRNMPINQDPDEFIAPEEPPDPNTKATVAPYSDRFVRGMRSRTALLYRLMSGYHSKKAPKMHIVVHYCIVTPKDNMLVYKHTKTPTDVQLIQDHDPMFDTGSFHTYALHP